MKDLDEHKKIAVLIDADNAQKVKIQAILNELSAHGHIVLKRAYGDWSNDCLKNWKTVLNELAVQPIQQFAYTVGKNSTDASMIIDAMDILYTGKIDAFAIISSDSDFTKLASRLRQSEIFVFGVGERKTPISFRNACDDFIFTENLSKDQDGSVESTTKPTLKSLSPILYNAWSQQKNDNGWANIAQLGSLLKRQMPDFDPRSYGASKISDLIRKLSKDFKIKEFPGKGNSVMIGYRPVKVRK